MNSFVGEDKDFKFFTGFNWEPVHVLLYYGLTEESLKSNYSNPNIKNYCNPAWKYQMRQLFLLHLFETSCAGF